MQWLGILLIYLHKTKETYLGQKLIIQILNNHQAEALCAKNVPTKTEPEYDVQT